MTDSIINKVSDSDVFELRNKIVDYCISNGLVLKSTVTIEDSKKYSPSVVHIPVTVFPTPFPNNLVKKVESLQLVYNELYAKIATNELWLSKIIEKLENIDDFIGKLWRLHLDVKKWYKSKNIETFQRTSFGIFRADYMLNSKNSLDKHLNSNLDHNNYELKLVEFNTIAASFAGLSSKASELHRFLIQSKSYPNSNTYPFDLDNLPVSPAIKGISNGLVEAFKTYGNPNSAVLFVVQPGERNKYDQLCIENILVQNNVKCIRVNFTNVLNELSLNQSNGLLTHVKSQIEIAVVYFRAGYSPSEYNSNNEWEARALLEKSKAIKAPSIIGQLAGLKKVQEVLSSRQELELFFSDLNSKAIIDQILETYMEILPLDDSPNGKKAISLIESNPQNYVLKPQREGGGNNIYGDDIPAFLKSLDKDTWSSYILMGKIQPPSLKNIIIKDGEIQKTDTISELGIFGTTLWDSIDGTILSNKFCGHLVRTKPNQVNEGGIAAGSGCIDSIYFT